MLRLDEAANLSLVLQNTGDIDCTVQISLNAVTFRISPPSPQSAHLPAKSTTVLPWNVVPTKTGRQEITFASGLRTFVKGFVVEDPTLLSDTALKMLSGLVAILGPMATLPWWLDRRKKRREDEARAKAESEKTRIILPS